ncbi:MAG: TRAP transporter TatT component family protein [Kofleriaceae bacterium]|nr:TRAP transporter TatT component family protein [Kofleriaceae bacterium]
MKFLLLVSSLLVTACSGFIDKQAANSTLRILEKSQLAAQRQPDLELAREAMPAGIIQLEAFALAYPSQRAFARMHADALCQYGVGFVFDDWEDADLLGRTEEAARLAPRVVQLARACIDANLALLPPAWSTARRQGGAAWDAMIAKATRADVPALLWITTADAVQLAIDPMKGIDKLGSITVALERSIALAPGFRESAAEILLGTLEAGRSQFLGGADGSARFAQARAQLGDSALMPRVMFARGTAVARKDHALFTSTLQAALAVDLTPWPDRRLANELARRKAARYLAAIERLIPAAPTP